MQYPLINGQYYSASSTEIQLQGKIYLGLKDISYSTGLDPGEVRGTRPQIIGRTRGTVTQSASMTMFMPAWLEFKTALGVGFMEVPFNINIIYQEEGLPTVCDTIIGARITSVENSVAGTEAIEKRLGLHVMQVLLGGTPVIKNWMD